MADKKPTPKNVPPNRAHDPSRQGIGETPIRTVRVPDKTWNAAKQKSKATGTTMSEVMVRSLNKFVGQ